METNNGSIGSPRASAKDFFLNLGMIVALYTTVISLLNLLFTVINNAYPQITNGYNYFGSQSISWPVAMLIIFFPIFVLLSWILERGYRIEPEKRLVTVKKWLTYITLFITGLAMAIDLVTILYYFIDGQELTMAFVMKILSVFVVTLGIFLYYISEIRGKLNSMSRKIWLGVSVIIVLASIIWGFAVLGSPATQRLYKYDEQKVTDLININDRILSYVTLKNSLPADFSTIEAMTYSLQKMDQQTQQPYEYKVTSANTYELCAVFNKSSNNSNTPVYSQPYPYGGPVSWSHPAGHYCFQETVKTNFIGNK